MKKIGLSIMTLLLVILSVPNIKAEGKYETYSIGDKVLIGEFGGHVIEDSDSSNGTVKVYIDGWNKTRDEWDAYWDKYQKDNGYTSKYDAFENVNFGVNYLEKRKLYNDTNYVKDDYINNVITIKQVNPNNFESDEEFELKTFCFQGELCSTVEFKYNWIVANIYGNFQEEYDESQKLYIEFGYKIDIPGLYITYTNFAIHPKYGLVQDNSSKMLVKQKCDIGIMGQVNDCPWTKSTHLSTFILTVNKSDVEKVIDKCSNYSESYNVNYNTNGGNSLEVEKVTGSISNFKTPTKEGYVFDGWYADSSLKNKVTKINPTTKYAGNGCLEGYNDVTIYAKWIKVLEKDNIKIISENDNLNSVNKIVVEKIETINEELSKLLTEFKAYDISLVDNTDKKVEIEGKVKVSIDISEETNKEDLGIYYINSEGYEEIPSQINGDKIEFETNHFSVYVVGKKNIVSNPETGDNIILYLGISVILVIGATILFKKLNFIK